MNRGREGTDGKRTWTEKERIDEMYGGARREEGETDTEKKRDRGEKERRDRGKGRDECIVAGINERSN